MDYQFIKVFLSSYSLPTLIIALSVAVLSIIADYLFKGRLPFFITNYAPFALSLLLYFIYDTAFVLKCFILREDTLISVILSGSLSLIFTRAYYSVKGGKALKSPMLTVIEELLIGVVKDDLLSATALAVESLIINSSDENDCQEIALLIAKIIEENSLDGMSETDLVALSTLILNAVSVL